MRPRPLTLAFSFLTRVPTRVTDVGDAEMRRASVWFPLVGSVIGLAVAGVYALFFRFLPSLLAATLAVAAGVLMTGGLHEDGLADTADGFGSGATGAAVLAIMRDSRVGTFGTLALLISVLWRVVALASVDPVVGLVGLVVAHSASRAGAVVLLALAPPAATDGLGKSMAAQVYPWGTVFAIVTALGIGVALAGWWMVPVVLLVGLAVVWLRRVSINKLGGISGDVLGACQQIGEMIVLAVVAGAAWQGSGPWWP